MPGYVYILSHKAMPGLVKIGYTTRSVRERIRELSGTTGVPGNFKDEYYVQIENPDEVEKLVHIELRQAKFEKEFFRVSVEVAVQSVKELLISEGFAVFEQGGRAKSAYLTDPEREKIREADLLRRKKAKELAEIKKQEEEAAQIEMMRQSAEREQINLLGAEFLAIAPEIDRIFEQKSILGSGSKMRFALGLLLVMSIVGWLIADKVQPPPFEDGVTMAKKLTPSEVILFKNLHKLWSELTELKSFQIFAEIHYKRGNPKNRFLISYYASGYRLGSLAYGVFKGLGLQVIES